MPYLVLTVKVVLLDSSILIRTASFEHLEAEQL